MSLVNGLGSVSEGDKQMKAATKLCQPSLLAMRLAADWDAATPLFEKAALNFKVYYSRCTGFRACRHCHDQGDQVAMKPCLPVPSSVKIPSGRHELSLVSSSDAAQHCKSGSRVFSAVACHLP